VIQKALSKDPDERFARAIDFAEGLRLGLQDTVGRPLDPLSKPSAPKEPPPPAFARNVKAIAKPPVPPTAPMKPAVPAATATTATTATTAMPVDDVRPRVLFVDDDERILNAVRALFRQEYNVTVAASGEAALEIVNGGGIHVVVSDQRMPGMTGVELLRKVRVAAPNAVRMLLTGYTDLASLVGSINDGEIFRFVKKPWDNDEIRADLADAVKVALAQAGTVEAKPESPRSAGSLLVIDPKESLARGLERLLAGSATVIQVATPADAAKALQGNEIAAIVADLGAGMDGLVALFKQVKAKRPGVHTILLADEPDAELGIELINKAQIFRFLPKPVSAKDLRHQVAEALRRYAAYKQSAAAKDTETGPVAARAPAAPLTQPA
jgi:eukaryotic-like serine/threonine-protein kinase